MCQRFYFFGTQRWRCNLHDNCKSPDALDISISLIHVLRKNLKKIIKLFNRRWINGMAKVQLGHPFFTHKKEECSCFLDPPAEKKCPTDTLENSKCRRKLSTPKEKKIDVGIYKRQKKRRRGFLFQWWEKSGMLWLMHIWVHLSWFKDSFRSELNFLAVCKPLNYKHSFNFHLRQGMILHTSFFSFFRDVFQWSPDMFYQKKRNKIITHEDPVEKFAIKICLRLPTAFM